MPKVKLKEALRIAAEQARKSTTERDRAAALRARKQSRTIWAAVGAAIKGEALTLNLESMGVVVVENARVVALRANRITVETPELKICILRRARRIDETLSRFGGFLVSIETQRISRVLKSLSRKREPVASALILNSITERLERLEVEI